jgi:hypothetical protein
MEDQIGACLRQPEGDAFAYPVGATGNKGNGASDLHGGNLTATTIRLPRLAAQDLFSTRPIIVCGMPRSGTSLMAELLRASGTIVVFDEYSPRRLRSFLPWLTEVAEIAAAEGWRRIEPPHRPERINELLFHSWRALTRSDRRSLATPARFGVKTPYGELDHTAYRNLLGRLAPVYIYTIRRPEDVYRSMLGMPWGDRRPQEAYDLWVSSLAAAAEISRSQDRLFVFDVDRSANRELREGFTRSIMQELLGRVPETALEFARTWPDVNRSQGAWQGTLSAPEVENRVEGFRSLQEQEPELDRLFEKLSLLSLGDGHPDGA